MRILHLAQSAYGGIASYLNEIAPAQIERYGSENVAFAIPSAHADQLTAVSDQQRALLPDPERSATSLARMQRRMSRIIRSWKPDLIHLHSTFAGALVRGPYLFRKPNHRVVYCAHGWSFEMDVSAAKRRVYTVVERMLTHVTDRVITISHFEHRAALAAGLPAEKLRQVNSGIGEIASKCDPASGAMPEISANKLNLLFVGRHDRQKGLDILLLLMNRLSGAPVHFYVVGGPLLSDGKTSSEQRPNASFYGWRSRNDVAKFMEAVDVVVVPSRWEGFGLVVLEAMRAGRAVMASDRSSLPEVVEDHTTGRIFSLGSPESFVDIIQNTSKAEWRAMGAAGRRRYREFYTADRMNREILSIYDELEPGFLP